MYYPLPQWEVKLEKSLSVLPEPMQVPWVQQVPLPGVLFIPTSSELFVPARKSKWRQALEGRVDTEAVPSTGFLTSDHRTNSWYWEGSPMLLWRSNKTHQINSTLWQKHHLMHLNPLRSLSLSQIKGEKVLSWWIRTDHYEQQRETKLVVCFLHGLPWRLQMGVATSSQISGKILDGIN